MQERSIRQELSEKQLLTGNRVARLLDLMDLYRHQVEAGLNEISAEPQSEAQDCGGNSKARGGTWGQIDKS